MLDTWARGVHTRDAEWFSGVALSPADIDHFPCGPTKGWRHLCPRQDFSSVQGLWLPKNTAEPGLRLQTGSNKSSVQARQHCGVCPSKRGLLDAWVPFILGKRFCGNSAAFTALLTVTIAVML